MPIDGSPTSITSADLILLSFRMGIYVYFIAVGYNYTYTYICGNIINNNDERTHFFRKIYLSHFIRKGCDRVTNGLCLRGELETEQTATYWPQVPLTIAALLSYSAGLLNRGSWGPKPSAGSWFSLPRTATRTPTNWLQLIWTSCRRGYIIICRPPTSCERHLIQPVDSQGYPLIPWYLWPDAPVVYTSAFLLLTGWSGSICNMFTQYSIVYYATFWDLNLDLKSWGRNVCEIKTLCG